MNISATFSVFKLFRDPALCLPHCTISTFNQLPIPLSKAFVKRHGEKDVDIRAVVLDKDNCFARPKENVVYSPYKVQWPGSLLTFRFAFFHVISTTSREDITMHLRFCDFFL